MAASRRNQTFDVFVGNLPADANEKNVGKLFTPYGEIGGIVVKESLKAKGPNKNFAFVKFLCEPDADKACADLDKMNVNGVEVTVKRADKERKRGLFDKKNPRTPDSEFSDGVGGSQITENYEAQINGVSKVLERLREMRETVMITHVENPITLWIQVVNDENTKKIFSITEQLATLCPAAKVVTGTPEPGKTYGSLYTEDNMWYRCQVKQTLGTDKYKIQYIDYGNTEEVNVSGLVEIPANVGNIKGLATKLLLHNTRAKDLSDKQGVQFLRSLTDNQMASLEKTRSLADGSGVYGQLYINDQSVGEAMTKAGFCQSRPGMVKTSAQTRTSLNDASSLECPGPQLMGQSMFTAEKDRNTASPLSNAGFQQMSGGMPENSKEKELQNELAKKRRELDKARSDKDSAAIQLEYMRSKVKTLQEEFAASAAKLQEDTMSKRVSTLVTLAKVVRHLRNQFPTNERPCMLKEAIDVCLSKDRVDNSKCTTLQAVGSALAKYKAAQDEISKCKQQSELDEIVKLRDDSRKQLHSSLTDCLEEIALLPLDERSTLVQELQVKLSNMYGEYLKLQIHDCPSIENVASGFNAWKTKKDTEFADVRTITDYSEGALQAALAQVKERISLDCESQTDKPEVDFDDLMKTYAHALQREISVTDLMRSKDANLVANVISSVIRELKSESAMLENFRVLQGEFKTRRETIAPWLEEKPTFSEMQESRKHLRGLRSKLRHKMADKIDAEEGGSEGELDSIKEEEEKIRSELQAALVKSDSFLHEVAALADSNFPELIVQYPDLAIDQFLVYKGLVKGNREIDHYSLSPGFKPGVHQSTFNGNPVLIQEFLLDQVSKEEFMKRVITYPGETFTAQAVFFSKNERQGYLEVACDSCKLIETAVRETTPTPHQLQQICLQLTQEVVTLHKHGCIHGEINTQSVLLRNNTDIALMNPDFSKSLQERLNKKVSTENGLIFQCPDVQYSTAEMIGPAADIYNLVLLMFWLHCPSPKQSPFTQGSQESFVQNLDPSLQTLFDGVLRVKSANRLAAEQILQINYFRKTLPDNLDPMPPVFQPVADPPLPLFQSVADAPPPVFQSMADTPPPVFQPVAAVVPPKSPTPPAQPPIIKSMDEPMEIGVFRAEDFPMPQTEEFQQTAVDTDDSWTTKSSSSGSRVESPLDDNVDANKDTVSDSVNNPDVSAAATWQNNHTEKETSNVTWQNDESKNETPDSTWENNTTNVTENVQNKEINMTENETSDITTNTQKDDVSTEMVTDNTKVESDQTKSDTAGNYSSGYGAMLSGSEAINNEVAPHEVTAAGDNVPDTAGDVFSQAGDSEYLKEERKTLGEILSESVAHKEVNTNIEDGTC